jgi:hypothetical protein
MSKDRAMHPTLWSRRRFLQGTGVALALPFLETLAPALARAQQAPARRRYISLYFPNGTADFWQPSGAGDSWTLSPILEPLLPVKSYVSVLSNVANYSPFGGHVEPSHSNCGAATWTCVQASGKDKGDSGISVDQVIANQLGSVTPLPSIQVGLSTLDSSTDGLPGQHSRSMSWKSATEPLYKLVNPQAVFDRLTSTSGASSGGDPAANAMAAMKRKALNKSLLDEVLASASSLQQKLSTSDRVKLDQYLASVRNLEKRVADPSMQLPATTCSIGNRPSATYSVGNVPSDYNRATHASLMIDLIVMALQCDLTRVVSFMLDDARSDFVYNFMKERNFTDTGSTEGTAAVGGYHGLQHAGDRNNGFATIGWWNAQQAALLAGKLAAIDEGAAGNLLQNTVIVLASGMHGGNHDAGNLPLALIGGGGKSGNSTILKQNQHFAFANEQRLADVHLTIMQRVFGCKDAAFGASSGIIADLLT